MKSAARSGKKETAHKEIIEDFMIAANGVTARYLSSETLFHPPRGAHSKTMGADRRACRRTGIHTAPEAGFTGTGGVSDKGAGN